MNKDYKLNPLIYDITIFPNKKPIFFKPGKPKYITKKINKACPHNIHCNKKDDECSYLHGNCCHSKPLYISMCYEYYSSYCFDKKCHYNHYPGDSEFRKYNNVYYYENISDEE